MNPYLDLFLTFAKVGVCTFGGGYAGGSRASTSRSRAADCGAPSSSRAAAGSKPDLLYGLAGPEGSPEPLNHPQRVLFLCMTLENCAHQPLQQNRPVIGPPKGPLRQPEDLPGQEAPAEGVVQEKGRMPSDAVAALWLEDLEGLE